MLIKGGLKLGPYKLQHVATQNTKLTTYQSLHYPDNQHDDEQGSIQYKRPPPNIIRFPISCMFSMVVTMFLLLIVIVMMIFMVLSTRLDEIHRQIPINWDPFAAGNFNKGLTL